MPQPAEKSEALGPASKGPGTASNADALRMSSNISSIHENKTLTVFGCTFSKEDHSLQQGRVCSLDQGACFNFSKPELVEKCPTLQAHMKGEPVGATPDLDYPGVPHVVESGPATDHVLGMPTEYLAGRVKKGALSQ